MYVDEFIISFPNEKSNLQFAKLAHHIGTIYVALSRAAEIYLGACCAYRTQNIPYDSLKVTRHVLELKKKNRSELMSTSVSLESFFLRSDLRLIYILLYNYTSSMK